MAELSITSSYTESQTAKRYCRQRPDDTRITAHVLSEVTEATMFYNYDLVNSLPQSACCPSARSEAADIGKRTARRASA